MHIEMYLDPIMGHFVDSVRPSEPSSRSVCKHAGDKAATQTRICNFRVVLDPNVSINLDLPIHMFIYSHRSDMRRGQKRFLTCSVK